MKKLLYTTLLLFSSCKLAYSANTSNTEEKITIRIKNKALTTQSKKISIPNNFRSEDKLKRIIMNTDFYKEILPKGDDIDFNLYNSTGGKLQEYLQGAKKDLKLEDDEQILIDFKDTIIFHDLKEQDEYQVKAGLSLMIQHLLEKIKDKDGFKKILKRETLDYYAILYRDEKNEYVNIHRIKTLWELKTKTNNIHLKLTPKLTEEKEDKKQETPEPDNEEKTTINDQAKKLQTPLVTSQTERYVVRVGLLIIFVLGVVLYSFYRKSSSSSEKTTLEKPRTKPNKRRAKR